MSSNNDATWTSWFCSLRGNEFFCEVDEDYITSQTNLYGLREQVPRYHDALSMILNVGTELTEFTDQVEQAAEMLYGLIHVRYILSKHGLHKMLGKYESGDFGRCSRVYCNSQAMLPIGLSDIPGEAMVKAYCPKCKEVYTPTASRHRLIDGAHFGTGFPDMMFMVYPEKRPARPESFVPRLFGFRIHP